MATIHPVVKRFARQLKRHRRVAGLTAAALARRARISRAYLTQLEGAVREPSIVTVVQLAKALGVPVTELLG